MSKDYECEEHGNGSNRFGKCQKGSCNNSYGKVLTKEQIENKRKAAYINWEKNRDTLVENIKRQANSIEGKKIRSETAKRLNEEGKIGGQLQKGKKHLEGCNCGNCIRTGNQFTNNGYVMSDKHKENISIAGKKIWEDENFREKMLLLVRDEERIAAFKETMKQYWEDEEWKSNISEKVSLLWEDSNYKSHMLDVLRNIRIQRPTSIENILFHFIQEVFSEYQIEREYRVGRKFIDVAIPELKLAFEADGQFWHNWKQAKEYDKVRDAYLSEQGWTVIRFPEEELKRIAIELR